MNDPLTLCLIIILIIAAAKDLQGQRIPNDVTFPLIAGALFYHTVQNGLVGFYWSIGGLAFGISILIIPYIMAGMGAGDVKLMGAVGAVLGVKGVLICALFSGMAGGVYAMILLVVHRDHSRFLIRELGMTLKMLVTTGNFIGIDHEERKARPKLCFAVAIAAGTFLHLFLSAAGYHFHFE